MTTHEITWKYILNQLVKQPKPHRHRSRLGHGPHHDRPNRTADPRTFLTALHSKGETPEELGALAAGMIAKAETVDINPHAVDIVGTGGDQQNTVNISTMAALVIAGTGATVVKHGNRASTSKSGSADVLEALGIRLDMPIPAVAECARETGHHVPVCDDLPTRRCATWARPAVCWAFRPRLTTWAP